MLGSKIPEVDAMIQCYDLLPKRRAKNQGDCLRWLK